MEGGDIIGNNILITRKIQHKTLKEVSKGTGISEMMLSRYERGKSEPKLKTWQKLADYFDVSVPYLQGISTETNMNESEHLIDPYVANQQGHGIFGDQLRIKNDSLIDMLCIIYSQYRDTSFDFISKKDNLTRQQKKKILDDFANFLEYEITHGSSN